MKEFRWGGFLTKSFSHSWYTHNVFAQYHIWKEINWFFYFMSIVTPMSKIHIDLEHYWNKNKWLSYNDYAYTFYPRPVLAFGYCRCLRLCVCVCVCPYVCQSLACPRDNSGPVQARIAKFGPKMQKTLVKVPIVLRGNWPWPSRSNLTSKSEFTPFWACPDHYSPPIVIRISKFEQQMHFSTVKIPVNSELDWPWTSPSFLIPKLFFSLWRCALRLWNCPWFVSMLFRDCFTVSIPVHMGTHSQSGMGPLVL